MSHLAPRIVRDHTELIAVHEHLLTQCFPDGDLLDPLGLIEQVEDGTTQVFATFDKAGVPVACAVGELFPQAGVALLCSLAVTPSHRRQSHGTRIYQEALRTWVDDHGLMVLAELEDPATGTAHQMFGDPEARVRFYAERGAQLLGGLPYFSPSEDPAERVTGMLLIACHVPVHLWGPEGAGSVDPVSLRAFLRANVEVFEGRTPTDAQYRALMKAARTRHGRALSDLRRAGRADLAA